MQSGSPIFLYSGSLETQYWRGFPRVGGAKLKMFALLDCSELPLRPVARCAVDNAAARGRRGQRCALTPDRPPPAHALPTAPLHRGGTPPGTPRRASARHTFLKISPEARKPSGLRPARLRLALPHWSADGWGEPRRPSRPCGGRACPPQGGRGNLPPPWSRPRRRAGRRKRSAQPTEGWAKGGRSPPSGGLFMPEGPNDIA